MYETVSTAETLVGCAMFVFLIGAAALVKIWIEETKKSQKKITGMKERRRS